MSTAWTDATGDGPFEYRDIRYEKSAGEDAGIAKITIARPEVRNAFRPRTIVEICVRSSMRERTRRSG